MARLILIATLIAIGAAVAHGSSRNPNPSRRTYYIGSRQATPREVARLMAVQENTPVFDCKPRPEARVRRLFVEMDTMVAKSSK